jgi:hypothetical protein
MDHYDDSDEEAAAAEMADDPDAPCPAVIARALGGRSAGIIVDDPYMAAAGGDSEDEDGAVAGLEGMDSEEVDDYTLRDSDLLLLAARNEDDVSTLEVWVYEEASSSTGEAGWQAWGGAGMQPSHRCSNCCTICTLPVVMTDIGWQVCPACFHLISHSLQHRFSPHLASTHSHTQSLHPPATAFHCRW